METNSDIIKNIQVLSKNCSDIINRISRKEEKAGSSYLIEVALGQEDIPNGLQVPIDEEGAKAAEMQAQMQAQMQAHGPRGRMAHNNRPNQLRNQGKNGDLIFREVTVPRFELVRRPVITPSKEILEKMTFSLEILPVNDLFNDKLDYSVSRCC